MQGLVESKELDEGHFRDVFEELGQRIEVEAEVVEHEPPRRLVVRLASAAFEAVSTQTLERSGGGTRLETVVETTYTKRLARLAGGFVTRQAQRRLEADLAALKALLETE